MEATKIFYIVLGLLTVLPLILFNLRRIFIKKPPEPMKINRVRMVVVLLISAVLVLFLYGAYTVTLHERYEITLERAAEKHAEVLVGKCTVDEFKDFIIENGTDAVSSSLETLDFGLPAAGTTVKFQIGSWCIPKYWQNQEGFEQAEILSDENPIYLMYLLDYDDHQAYYALRMIKTEDGWFYDWIGEASAQQQTVIKMPTQKNGKWYSVSK